MTAAPPRIFRAGDMVTIGHQGRKIPARVTLASDNGKSLAVEFEGILGGHVGGMPLLWEDGCFRVLFTRDEVSIAPQQ